MLDALLLENRNFSRNNFFLFQRVNFSREYCVVAIKLQNRITNSIVQI